jgi:undecaprenyl-diphosphatase
MTILQSILLGIVQGLTEFLPVSSSGHLVLVPYLLNWDIPQEQAFVFDVLVQLATLAAVFSFFWRDIAAIVRSFVKGILSRKPFADHESRLGWYILLATIPAGLFGLLIKDYVEAAFDAPIATATFLLVTAALLLLAEWALKRPRDAGTFNWKDALVMGLFQALAIFPGISRSGSTLTGGMIRQLDRPTAARFSFIMSIPIMLAAGLLAVVDIEDAGILTQSLPVFLPGFIVSAVTGYLAIRWLLKYLTHRPLYIFSIYCVALALVVFFRAASVPAVREIPEQGEIYRIEISTDLTFLEDDLYACAGEAGLLVTPAAEPSWIEADLAVVLGEPAEPAPFMAGAGRENILPVVHTQNPVETLSLQELRDIYSGQADKFQAGQAEIVVWTYPSGHAVGAVFDRLALGGGATTSSAYLAPGSQEMLEAVSADPQAVGYLLEPWVNEDVRVVEIEAALPEPLSLPVLVLGKAEPEGSLRNITACFQERRS